MSKADKIRAAGRDAGAEGITGAQVVKIAGSTGAISNMVKTGEFSVKDDADGRRYVIDPDYKRDRKAAKDLPIKRQGKNKSAKAEKVVRRQAAPSIHEVALDNLMAAGRQQLTAIHERVEGLEDDSILSGAVDMYERSARMEQVVAA